MELMQDQYGAYGRSWLRKLSISLSLAHNRSGHSMPTEEKFRFMNTQNDGERAPFVLEALKTRFLSVGYGRVLDALAESATGKF